MSDIESAPETEEEVEEEKTIDPLTLFSPNVSKAVDGLLHIGQISETVHFCGHSFGLRTLKPQYKYAISIVLQPYRNTIYEVDVFQNLHVATALTHVDGKHDFCPAIGPDIEDFVRGRLNYVASAETGWYAPTLEFLWTSYALLDATATTATAELHRLSLRSQPTTSSPWLDSLKDPGRLADVMNSDSQPSTTSS